MISPLHSTVKQGRQFMIVQLDLTDFDDELAILCGSSDNNKLLDSSIAEIGGDPEKWLPEFHSRNKVWVDSSIKT